MDTSVNAANQQVSVYSVHAFVVDPMFVAVLDSHYSTSSQTTLPRDYGDCTMDGRECGE